MLTDEQYELLTAAVDGELTPAGCVAFRRLLDASPEARTFFARLQADCIGLRNLPVVPPPADLTARIMARLPAGPVVTPAPARSVWSRPWVSIAVAASLLLAVGTGSALFFVKPNGAPEDNGPHVADAGQPTPPIQPAQPAPTPPRPNPPREVVQRLPAPEQIEPLPDRSQAQARLVPWPTPPAPKTPAPSPVVGAPPVLPVPPLDKVKVRVPFLAPVNDLDREDARRRLLDELDSDAAFRIDLFARDVTRGTELLQAAVRGRGVVVHTDAATHERLRRKQAVAYLMYTESLTPAEVADLFARLAAVDAKNQPSVFDTLHVAPAQPADQKDVKDVLGTDPGAWKRVPGAADPKAPKTGAKQAVLMTFGPPQLRTNPLVSKELKLFLNQRGERKPATVPVVVVIRPASS